MAGEAGCKHTTPLRPQHWSGTGRSHRRARDRSNMPAPPVAAARDARKAACLQLSRCALALQACPDQAAHMESATQHVQARARPPEPAAHCTGEPHPAHSPSRPLSAALTLSRVASRPGRADDNLSLARSGRSRRCWARRSRALSSHGDCGCGSHRSRGAEPARDRPRHGRAHSCRRVNSMFSGRSAAARLCTHRSHVHCLHAARAATALAPGGRV